ncbi:MAG: T9SS type A sorting domain-containing protein [Chitinophagaceae bacterium]|nr:MAG: T9SS type A sorting domain-containing protein [Chitinophagaceae bacterium]
MQSKTTFNKMKKVFKTTALALGFLSLFNGLANAQTYVNGNLSTGATAENGTAAPAGYTWSEVQHDAGNTTVANNTIGSSATGTNSVADDFVVTGAGWAINKLTVYGYSTNYAGTTSPFTALNVRIWSGNPASGGTVVYGNLTTNVMSATSDALMYRISNTVVPAPLATNTARKIWKIEANINVTLPAGTYWVEYRMTAGALGNFAPHSTPVGARSLPGYNAMQNLNGVWNPLLDTGFPVTPPDVPVDMPFTLNYSTTPCSGTPTPGNTIASSTSTCSNLPVNFSLQNLTSGIGVTYQWQTGPSATGPFTNIPGATGSGYTANPTATAFYQAVVTCGASSGTSTPVQVAVTPCYCTAGATSTSFEKIGRVAFGTINNASTGTAGYEDFTAISTNAYIGSTMPITVTLTGGFAPDQVKVWIDFNRDFDFDDAGELVYTSANGVGPHTGNIVIPATVAAGTTRMRVRMHDTSLGANATPCGTSTYGQVEDYTLNMVPCVPATVTTQPAAASATCGSNASFTVVLAGSDPVAYWQYKTSAASTNWIDVPNAAPYSGINTTTLTITGATAALNGYQYRAVYRGACTGASFSNAATLTVTALVPVVTPASATICSGSVQALSLTNILSATTLYEQGFNNWAALAGAGWSVKNNSGIPTVGLAAWEPSSAYTGVFTPNTGTGYAATSYLINNDGNGGSGGISGWLFGPQATISNGDIITFYIRALEPQTYPERLQVRLSGSGASTNVGTGPAAVGDFTTLLLDVNPTYQINVIPAVWTQMSITVSGLAAPVNGRVAFRYLVENDVAHANFLGIDDVKHIAAPSIAQGTWSGPAGTIFTNLAATTPYTGTPATTVYVKPTATGVNNYTVSYATALCQSSTTTVAVTARALPTTITAVANASICQGGNTSFTSTATGGSPSGIQWQVSSDNGASYTNVADGGVYSGATTGTLTITGAGTNLNNNRYRLVASAAPCAGTVASAAGVLTVNPLPVLNLTANPFTAIYPGQTTTLAVASTTTVPAGGYTWYRNGVVVPGATGNTLVVDVDGIGDYTVTVADANGCGNAVPASITIASAANDMMFVYPSPNSGQFQIRYYSAAGNNPLPRTVNIYDSKGARVYSKTYTVATPYTRMDVDMTRFQKGIYQVELADRTGSRLKTGRVVIL